MRSTVLLAAFLLLASGCNKKPIRQITDVPDDDPRMIAAIQEARDSASTFAAVLDSPKPSQSGFALKMRFSDGDATEHMWLTSVSFDGKLFHGTVGNVPEKLKNVKMGQRASVDPSKISDWMYIDNRKLVGGYTTRVVYALLTQEERMEFDRTAPFVID